MNDDREREKISGGQQDRDCSGLDYQGKPDRIDWSNGYFLRVSWKRTGKADFVTYQGEYASIEQAAKAVERIRLTDNSIKFDIIWWEHEYHPSTTRTPEQML